MRSEYISVSVKGLTKQYRLFDHPGDRVKQFFSFGLKQFHRNHSALSNVSFDVHKGETVGIVGRNGAGKSTLLQLICGILKPTSGTVQANGRVSALLELGAGFNPEFTGRENVYFHAALMGLSEREISVRIDDILEFADIGRFVDQPVRTYSSGMFVRLAFAVAIHMEPEILIVDEALAVGDSVFQAKCLAFFRRFRAQGGTMLIVSHDIRIVKALCDVVVCLKHDGGCDVGPAEDVLGGYMRELKAGSGTDDAIYDLSTIGSFTDKEVLLRLNADFARRAELSRQGTGEARVIDATFVDESGQPIADVDFAQPVAIKMRVQFNAPCEVLAAYYVYESISGERLVGSSTLLEGAGLLSGGGGDEKMVVFKTQLTLAAGSYGVSLQLSTPLIENVSSQIVDYVENAVYFQSRQRNPVKIWSKVYLDNQVTVTGINT